MPVAPEAVLQDQEGRPTLRFERRFPHPPERVWRALTEPTELGSWHPTPLEFEPVKGGTVTYLSVGDAPEMPEGRVTEYDPPRVFAHSWGEDQLRWELRPQDEGCLLVLTHTFDDRFKAARDAAGWHLCLNALSAALEGEPDRGLLGEDWRGLNRSYEKRFGIPPERATPPPST